MKAETLAQRQAAMRARHRHEVHRLAPRRKIAARTRRRATARRLLRRGCSVEYVAERHGVPVAWVQKWIDAGMPS